MQKQKHVQSQNGYYEESRDKKRGRNAKKQTQKLRQARNAKRNWDNQ